MPTKNPKITIVLTPSMDEYVRSEAAKNHRTLSQWLALLINEHYVKEKG